MAAGKSRGEETPVPLAPCVIGHILLWVCYLGLLAALSGLSAILASAAGLWRAVGLLMSLGGAALAGWVVYHCWFLPDWRSRAVGSPGLRLAGRIARVALVAVPAVGLGGLMLVCAVLGLAGRPLGPWWPRHYAVLALTQALACWLAVWMWRGFVRLADWTLAPEVPLGLKLTGHLARVSGTVGVASYAGLCVQAIVGSATPRPGPAAFCVLMVFALLLFRLVGSAICEARRWARVGGPVVAGAFLVVFVLLLILNVASGQVGVVTVRAAGAVALWAAVFVFLLAYFSLPRVAEAFNSHGL